MKKNNLFTFLLLIFTILCSTPNTSKAQVFSAADVGINSGNEVCVDVSTAGFHDLIAVQFSMHYDESLLEFTGFSNLSSTLSLTENDFGTSVDGTVNFLWIDQSLSAVSLTDDVIIFSLCFTAVASQSAITPIHFDGMPTNIEAVDVNENILIPNFIDGSVTISGMGGSVGIWGSTLLNEICENSTGSIFPDIIGGTLPFTYLWTGPDGFTSTTENITGLSAGEYNLIVEDSAGEGASASFIVENDVLTLTNNTIIPAQCDQETGSIAVETNSTSATYLWNTGATTASIAAIPAGEYTLTITEGTCVLVETFEVANSLLLSASIACSFPVSADVSAAAWTGTAPITFEWSTGFSETIEEGIGEPIISTITVPFGAYTVTVTDAGGCTGELAIDASCDDNTGDLFFTISPEETHLEVGESTCIDVVVANFQDIISLQFGLTWDESLLVFDEVNNFGLPALNFFNFGTTIPGNLLVSWTDVALLGETFPDGESIFSVCFTAIAEGTSSIQFTEELIEVEVLDSNQNEVSVSTNNGLVVIGDEPVGGTPSVFGSSEAALIGETVCVDINATNITNVVAMQFSMTWDADALNFLGVEDFLFENETQVSLAFSPFEEAAETGELRFLFVTNDVQDGYTFLTASKLFALCFEATANFGTYPINITSAPIPLEFIDVNEWIIPVVASAGEVIIEEAVWPGDTDQDGVVNHYDLLNIGLAYEATGAARSTQNINWTPYYIQNWEQSTPISNIDFKHIDADGNGFVDVTDQAAIEQNWGESTDFWEQDTPDTFGPETVTNEAASFYVMPDTLIEGQTAMLDIILGEEILPAEDVYGVAFTIVYDAEIVEPGSVHARFENSWLGNIGENMLSIYREEPETGKLHVAITRIDGINISGHGRIGQMEITIQDVIFREGLIETDFQIENVKLISYNEEDIPVQGMLSTSFVDVTTGINDPVLSSKISVFPTPTNDVVTILTKGIQIQKMELLQMDGKYLQGFDKPNTISLKNRGQGAYLLKIITEEGVIIKRLFKI